MTFFERPEGLPAVTGYSHVVSAAGTVLFVSGQVPARADGSIVDPLDVEAQCEQVFTNLRVALAAGGATWADVVKMTYFLTDMADLSAVRAVRDRHLDPQRMPASTLVQVAGLVNPEYRVEIDAIAIV